jgi:hypothetical protein
VQELNLTSRIKNMENRTKEIAQVFRMIRHHLLEVAEINLKSEKEIRRKIDKEIELIFKFTELGFDYLSGEE